MPAPPEDGEAEPSADELPSIADGLVTSGSRLRQHRGEVRRSRGRRPDVGAGMLRQEPAVLEDLVEHLGRRQPAEQIGRDRLDDRAVDLGDPAVPATVSGSSAPSRCSSQAR